MAASEPKSRVKFHFSCQKLVNKDLMSKSDPMVVVNVKTGSESEFSYVGQTEWQRDDINPKFTTQIEMDYTFEVKQIIRFIVIDVDDPNKVPTSYVPHMDEGDLLGMAETTMADLVRSRTKKMKLFAQKSSNGKDYGTISVVCEQMADDSRQGDTVVVTFAGHDLKKMDGPFGKSDPYIIIKRQRQDGAVEEVARTEIVMSNLNPIWQPLRISMSRLCNGDLQAPVILSLWDYDQISKDDFMGEACTCVSDLLQKKALTLSDPKKPGSSCGTISSEGAEFFRMPTFLDYITEGCQVSLTVAVDFTASNGATDQAGSLHYDDPSCAWNPYQEAIIGVGEVLVPYDSDGNVVALGYGGIPSGENSANFCFPLNPTNGGEEVPGVQGVLDAYAHSIKICRLYGPTNMAPIIEHANMMGREYGKQHYQVLMILTDGEITDMRETMHAIVQSSRLPMSIVIVGISNDAHSCDFEDMRLLDGDDQALTSPIDGVKAVRDVVQFVPFRAGQGKTGSQVAKDVLNEIPRQLVQYKIATGQMPTSWEGKAWNLLPLREALEMANQATATRGVPES